MSCWETIADYAFRSIGFGERLLPRSDFTLCQQMTLIGSGFKLAHGGGEITRAPALLNEHADEILAEAGYEEAEIGEMKEAGVV